MWTTRYLPRLDVRMLLVILALMGISLLALSSFPSRDLADESVLTPLVRHQLRGFALGGICYFLAAAFDYNKLREWTWILYALMLLSLIGLFFTEPIQHVHRWYRVPFIGMNFQPSEYAKLIVVIALSWYLERRRAQSTRLSTAFFGFLIAFIPFLLILKQPDLGTALVLMPITLVMFYFGDLNIWVLRLGTALAALALLFVAIMFLNILPHETARPYVTRFIRDYQYERLNPNTHHQQASATAIALGGMSGAGFGKGEYAKGGWLPEPMTDSIFSSFGEEWGLFGLFVLMSLFYALIYFSFQVTALAKDSFGRLLSAGITVYLAMHILVNIGMMCGVLPITGVPLLLISYGGSSVLATMTTLGLLQSIYSRRFMF